VQEVAEEKKILKESTAMRKKELGAFEELTAELTQTISAGESALEVLKKHQSLLQAPGASEVQVFKKLKSVLSGAPELATALTGTQLSALNGFLAKVSGDSKSSFLQQPTAAAYASQSGQVYGMIAALVDDATANKKDAEETEGAAVAAFGEMKKLKTDLIAKKTAHIEKKTEQKGDAESALAQAKQDLEACTNTLGAEQKMLPETIKTCKDSVVEMEKRSKARDTEAKAVDKALEFLQSDEARDLFHGTFAFVQVREQNKANQAKRNAAAAQLLDAGKHLKEARFMVLAQVMKAGQFDKVLKAVDALVKEIKATQAADLEEHDTCKTVINEKKELIGELTNKVTELEANLEKQTQAKANAEDAIAVLTEDIATMEKAMQEAGSSRDEENKAFVVATQNNQATKDLLKKTLAVLEPVFSLAQQPAQPEGFKEYNTNSGGNPVLQMLENIINDSDDAMSADLETENQAQEAYGKYVEDTQEVVAAKQSEKDAQSQAKLDAEEKMASAEASLNATKAERTAEEEFLAAKEKDCKFILENLHQRQEHQNSELKALKSAHHTLTEMNDF